MPEISFIIVTYNPGETVLACLDALYKHADGLDFEVIVVDNDSQDDTPNRVKTHYPQATHLETGGNFGYGGGNNRGFAIASGEYIVILNPDVKIRAGAVQHMIEYMNQNPSVGIVGPKTYDNNNQPVITARQAYTVPRLLARYLGFGALFPQWIYGTYGALSLKTEQPLDVDWVQGSALAIRRDLYTKLGGFDDGFFLFLEDVDLCMRAHEAGLRVIFLPYAQVEHVGSESVSRFPVKRIRSYQISPLYYYRKRSKHAQVLILKIGFIVSLAFKSSFRRLKNMIKPDEKQLEQARVESSVIKDVWNY